MRKSLVIIMSVFCFAACNLIPVSPNSPADSVQANPEVMSTSSPNPSLYVTNTPSVVSTPTQTQVPMIETARPWTATPIPSSTERANLPLQPGQRVDFTSIRMIDPQNGWGFDSDYHILRTRDGGTTWQSVTPPTGWYTHAGFFALNADTAWSTFTTYESSMPTTAYVLRTSDGGTTWTPSQEFRLDLDTYGEAYPVDFYMPITIQFIDSQTGWLLVITYSGMNSTTPLLFHTTDGGQTWTVINDRSGNLGGMWGCVNVGFAFMDTQTGWVGGNCFYQGVVLNPLHSFFSVGGWMVNKTVDGGHTFDQETLLPLPPELQQPDLINQNSDCGEIRTVPIAPDVVGIEWGCNIFPRREPDYRFFALTADGGKTWNSWRASGNEFFLDGTNGWRLLSPGQLQRTNEGGLTWITIKSVTWEDAQFDFISEQEGWGIVSNDGTTALIHTHDGGATWAEIKPLIAP